METRVDCLQVDKKTVVDLKIIQIFQEERDNVSV